MFEWSVAIAGAIVLVCAAWKLRQVLREPEVKRDPKAKSAFEIALFDDLTKIANKPGWSPGEPLVSLAAFMTILERRVIELEEKAAKRWWQIGGSK